MKKFRIISPWKRYALDICFGLIFGIAVGMLGGSFGVLLLVLFAYLAGIFYLKILRLIGAVE